MSNKAPGYQVIYSAISCFEPGLKDPWAWCGDNAQNDQSLESNFLSYQMEIAISDNVYHECVSDLPCLTSVSMVD
jgi:hypothetical protein